MEEKEVIKLIDEYFDELEKMSSSELAAYIVNEGNYDPIWDDIYNITKTLSDMDDTQ
jgi:hypothetical protein